MLLSLCLSLLKQVLDVFFFPLWARHLVSENNLYFSLFLEVYAAREKNGIYIPRDRYLNEEAEKKVSFGLFGFWEIF